MPVFLSSSSMHRSDGGVRHAEQDRVAGWSGLGVGRRPQMSAVQSRGPVSVRAVHEGHLKRFSPADASSHQRSDMVYPLRAARPGNRGRRYRHSGH